MTKKFKGFELSLLHFLHDLAQNNNREWFEKNKPRYEELVRGPALEFIESIAKPLGRISPHFQAVAKKSGGSLMRVYRDTRFSKDKRPYKTNVGIHFRHEQGKNVHAPGFYFHIEPEEVFVGAGIWHPDSETLGKIRQHLHQEPTQWKRATNSKAFREKLELAGDSLKRPPRGYDQDHPLIDDLKRKDFIAAQNLDVEQLFEPTIVTEIAASFRTAKPLVRFICDAIKLPC